MHQRTSSSATPARPARQCPRPTAPAATALPCAAAPAPPVAPGTSRRRCCINPDDSLSIFYTSNPHHGRSCKPSMTSKPRSQARRCSATGGQTARISDARRRPAGQRKRGGAGTRYAEQAAELLQSFAAIKRKVSSSRRRWRQHVPNPLLAQAMLQVLPPAPSSSKKRSAPPRWSCAAPRHSWTRAAGGAAKAARGRRAAQRR